jgi:hypothetical protein
VASSIGAARKTGRTGTSFTRDTFFIHSADPLVGSCNRHADLPFLTITIVQAKGAAATVATDQLPATVGVTRARLADEKIISTAEAGHEKPEG